MPAYVIVTEVVHDPDGMRAYGKAAGPTIAASGATVLAADASPQVLEGEWPATQTVMLQFPTVEAARGWYDSEEYQAAAKLRHAAATSSAVIVSGLG